MLNKNKTNNTTDNNNFYLLNQLIRQNKIRIFDYRTKKELYILQDVANSVDGTFDIFIKNEDADLINELKNLKMEEKNLYEQ